MATRKDIVHVEDDISEYEKRCSRMKFLLETIKDISDIKYQQQSWVERSIPDNIDNWEECMCRFFDDNGIDEFLEDLTPEAYPEFGLSQKQIDQLWKLRDNADYYCSIMPEHIDSSEVIEDPRWHEVVACAQETLKAFEGYQVPIDPRDAVYSNHQA